MTYQKKALMFYYRSL